MICPRLLIPRASIKNIGEPGGMRVLRLAITPLCHSQATVLFPSGSWEKPTTWPVLLMALARLAGRPGRVPKVGHCPVLPRERAVEGVAGHAWPTTCPQLLMAEAMVP